MGAWEELDTEISVEVDTTDIDSALAVCDEYFLDDVRTELENIKKGIDEGSKEGIADIATRNRSFQQQLITDISEHPYARGMLGSSIIEEEQDEYTWLVGTRINHIYPMAVEYGRDSVEPVNAKVLFFYALSGEPVWTKHVGPAEPRPFVAPAYDKTDAIAEEIMLRYIGRNL